MDAGRIHKSLGSEVKHSLLLIAITVIRVLLFISSQNLVPIGWLKEGQMTLAHAVGCIIGIAHQV